MPAIPSRLPDRIFSTDPGFERLFAALRGLLAVGGAFLVLLRLTQEHKQPITLAFLGTMIAMMSSMLVNDTTSREQRITMAIIPFPACLSLLIGMLLSFNRLLDLAPFLLLTFAAVSLRRYGPRASALGGMTYMCYFYSLFFPLRDIPFRWIILSVTIGTASSYLMRFWVLREQPALAFRTRLLAFEAYLRHLMRRLAVIVEKGSVRHDLSFLHRPLNKVNELSLALDEILHQGRAGVSGSNARTRAMQGRIFEMELSIRRMIECVSTLSSHPDLPIPMRRQVAEKLREASRLDSPESEASIQRPIQGLSQVSPELRRTLSELDLAIREFVRSSSDPLSGAKECAYSAPPAPRALELHSTGLHPYTRQGIQATLATTLAIALGTLISPQRWYWAAITAFVVFTGASRGDNMRRALHRILGTTFGLAVGVLLANLLEEHRSLQLSLVFGCIFCAIYSLRSAYVWTALWFSLLIAMFYGVLGQLTTDILLIRMEETLVGAGAGALMAFAVLPISTRRSVYVAFSNLLRTESYALSSLIENPEAFATRRSRHHLVRALERDLASLRITASAISGRMAWTRSPEIRGLIHDAGALLHYTRHLIVFFTEETKGKDPQDMKARFARAAERSAFLADVAHSFESSRSAVGPTLRSDHSHSGEAPRLSAPQFTASHSLDQIDQILRSLSKRMDLP